MSEKPANHVKKVRMDSDKDLDGPVTQKSSTTVNNSDTQPPSHHHRRVSLTRVFHGKFPIGKHHKHHKDKALSPAQVPSGTGGTSTIATSSFTESPKLTPSTAETEQDAIINISRRGSENVNTDRLPSRSNSKHSLHHHLYPHSDDGHNQILEQVQQWLEAEKARKFHKKSSSAVSDTSQQSAQDGPSQDALDRLEQILASATMSSGASFFSQNQRSKRPRSLRNYTSVSYTGSMSDAYTTDNAERTILHKVPACDASLDNSKENSTAFKTEILKLTHTLKIKGWRKIKLQRGGELQVKRISGALTNAVYKLTPPYVDPAEHYATNSNGSMYEQDGDSTPELNATPRTRSNFKQPRPLLLRIYGPQVGYLIDRETELSMLQRLAQQHVGPRMLGTFENGRFEEFYDARTLTRKDIRDPETSRLIGKRIRELHDHIPLLNCEREAGAALWCNWDKWVARGEKVMHILETVETDKRFVVTKWSVFREVMEKRYRPWLEKYCRSDGELKAQLIFAHNDTQYGNIMSKTLQPPQYFKMADMDSGTISAPRSTSMTPKTAALSAPQPHQDLIVIDFEYAGANTRGFEFANHFSEWCSDYHCQVGPSPYLLHENLFPTISEQRNMIRAYVEFRHLPYTIPTTSNAPTKSRKDSSYHVSELNLDKENATDEEDSTRTEIDRLLEESRYWRAAANGTWALWGVVQANVPGMDGDDDENTNGVTDTPSNPSSPTNSRNGETEKQAEDDGDEFDYVRYAEQKAMLFWGDMLILGLVTEEEMAEWSGTKDFKSKIKLLEGK